MKSKIVQITTISLIIVLLIALIGALMVIRGRGFSKFTLKNQYIMLTKQKVDAAFIGNSITDFWMDLDPNFFTSNNYVSRGVGGEATHHLVARFREDVINLKPKVVVINGGVNDISDDKGYNPDFTFNNIVAMAKLAHEQGIKVVITSVTPVKTYYWNPEFKGAPERISAMNERLKQYALENNFAYVDYHTSLTTEDGGLNPDYGPDGVHPSLDGYKMMEPLVKKAIDSVIKK